MKRVARLSRLICAATIALVVATPADAGRLPPRDDLAGPATPRPAADSGGAPAPVVKRPASQLYDNGPLVNSPGTGAGGADESVLQTNLGLNVLGFGHSQTSGLRIADEFTIPAPQTWRVSAITFYAYQTGAGAGSTINFLNLRIWNGAPGAQGSTVVWGNPGENVLGQTGWSGVYRVADDAHGDTQRAIMANTTADLGLSLPPGTYWLDWQTGGSDTYSGPWAPPISINGQTTTGNALRYNTSSGLWEAALDNGTNTRQGFPFIIQGETIVCYALATVAYPTAGGTVGASPPPDCGAKYTSGASVQLTATPGAGYAFSQWTGDASGSANPVVVNMTTDRSVTAKFVTDPPTTFLDVSTAYWAYTYIESLYNSGITSGCVFSPDLLYCPEAEVTRAQMAVFVLRGVHGAAYAPPPATGAVFSDVPASHWAAAWIEQLAAEGITSGCGPGLYCPEDSITRAQMPVYLLRARHGAGYTPPPATGAVFGDVPASHWAAGWIEQLATEGITGGCGGGNYCPESNVTRAQMAVFLVRTFDLPPPP